MLIVSQHVLFNGAYPVYRMIMGTIFWCPKLIIISSGWASRVFFSDNGSTAIEIALKMAFRKFSFDHGLLIDPLKQRLDEKCVEYKVHV